MTCWDLWSSLIGYRGWAYWRKMGAKFKTVPSIQIKSVSDDVRAELRRRAAVEGKSLQEYLLGRLINEARFQLSMIF